MRTESQRLDEQEAIAFWVVLLICGIVLYALAAQAGLVPQVPDITWTHA
jgi:hypothetical protein